MGSFLGNFFGELGDFLFESSGHTSAKIVRSILMQYNLPSRDNAIYMENGRFGAAQQVLHALSRLSFTPLTDSAAIHDVVQRLQTRATSECQMERKTLSSQPDERTDELSWNTRTEKREMSEVNVVHPRRMRAFRAP